MGYLRNHLATVVVSAFAAFLTGMYFVLPSILNFFMLVVVAVTWFLAFMCWIVQKGADYSHRYVRSQEQYHTEKKSSISLTTQSKTVPLDELTKFRESFTADLNQLKDEVKLKDEEISRLRQQIASLQTQVQIEALKAELANLKVLAAKEKSSKRK
jgi:predicted membrane protein